MKIEIKKSKKPIDYSKAMVFLEKRLNNLDKNFGNELIWTLQHKDIFTAGISSKQDEILDKSIKIQKTNRGGKITFHGSGQLIFYFVINLKNRKKDIRKFLKIIEDTIILTLKEYNIKAFADRSNVGIWVEHKKSIKKIASIGIKIKNWIAYHGFAINISTDLKNFEKIIPCGLKNAKIINLNSFLIKDYSKFEDKLIMNFIDNLSNLNN